MGKPQIVLAIPTGRPLPGGRPPSRILRFAQKLSTLMPEFEVHVAHTSCPREAHAVNSMIEEFRNEPDAQWFVWWNIEVEITPEEMKKLLTAGRAVVGALYTDCEKKPDWMANFYPDMMPDENKLVPVPELGAGVKVFHRSVFDLIENANPMMAYIFDHSGRSLFAFCQESLAVFGDYRRLLCPAYSLDLLCRKSNIGIFAHSQVVLKRRGPDGILYPRTEIYHPWLHRKEPPPVCAEDLPAVIGSGQPITICIQYCLKDAELAERLRKWIIKTAAIEPMMVFSPGHKYPKGPNDTALRLLRKEWPDCKGVLLLEPDCVPVAPDWLDQLSRDWDRALASGKLIMGSWHPVNQDHPTLGHLNGNLMFSPDIAKRITIPEMPDDHPWDTWLAEVFQPHWCRTGLIKNLNRHKTATIKQMTEPECGTRPPVLIHGVRDESAWNLAQKNNSP